MGCGHSRRRPIRRLIARSAHHRVAPLWKWPDLYGAIQTVANMHGLDGKRSGACGADQPGLLESTEPQTAHDHTYDAHDLAAFEPGEWADHRHNFAAFRFILKATALTRWLKARNSDARRRLDPTPSMTWHGHRNGSERWCGWTAWIILCSSCCKPLHGKLSAAFSP